MAFAFPSATSVGQLYTYGATTWEWDGTVWNVQPSFGDIKMSITADNEIDTKTLDLILDSATGETQIDDNLTVTGTLDVTGITAFTTDVSVGGAFAATGAATLGNTLAVTGTTTLNGAVTSNNIVPLADNTHDLGSSGARWGSIYANAMNSGNIQVGTRTDKNFIETTPGSDLDLCLSADSGFLQLTDDAIIDGALTVMRSITAFNMVQFNNTMTVTGDSTLSNVVPDTDNAKDLGSSSAAWKDVYANKVMLGDLTIDGATNTISSATNSIVIDPAPSGDGGDVTIAGNILITGSTTGGASTLGNVTITGDLTVNGTTTTVNSTTVTLDDPVMTLGGDTPAGSDDGLDRGIEFRWHDGAADKVGFFGWDRSAQKFSFMPDATNTGEVFSGALGNVAFGAADFTGNVVPSAHNTYELGSVAAYWNSGYFNELVVDRFVQGLKTGDIQVGETSSNTIDTINGVDLNLYADSQAVRTAGTFYAEEIEASSHLRVSGTETTINDLHLGGGGFNEEHLTACISAKDGATAPDIRFTYDRTQVNHAYMQVFSNGRMQIEGAGQQLTIKSYNGTTDTAGIVEIGAGGYPGMDDSNYCSGFNVWAEDTQTKNVLPHDDVTWDLGSASKKWNHGYFDTLTVDNFNATPQFGNIQIAVTDDQTIDTTSGDLVLNSASGFTKIQGSILFVPDGSASGTSLTTNSGDLNLASSSGTVNINSLNVNLYDKLTVGGATTLQDSLAVTGAATMASTLGVTGAVTAGDTLAVTNGATVGGTLGVIGASSLAGVAADTINPNADLTHDLGGAALRWNAVYAKTINMIDPATPGTNIELSVVSNDLYVDGVKVGGSATVDTTAPSDPDEGMFWMDRNSGILYIWVVNATTGNGNWIQPL